MNHKSVLTTGVEDKNGNASSEAKSVNGRKRHILNAFTNKLSVTTKGIQSENGRAKHVYSHSINHTIKYEYPNSIKTAKKTTQIMRFHIISTFNGSSSKGGNL